MVHIWKKNRINERTLWSTGDDSEVPLYIKSPSHDVSRIADQAVMMMVMMYLLNSHLHVAAESPWQTPHSQVYETRVWRRAALYFFFLKRIYN